MFLLILTSRRWFFFSVFSSVSVVQRCPSSDGGDSTIKVWDATTYELIASLEGHTDYVQSVAFSTNGPPLIASGSGDNTIKVWDGTTYGLITTLTGGTVVGSVAFSSHAPPLIVSGSFDTTIKVWDVITRS